MNTKTVFYAAAIVAGLTACDNAGKPSHQSAGPAPEVRGQAIAKLQEQQPAVPVAKAAEGPKPAPSLELPVNEKGEAVLPVEQPEIPKPDLPIAKDEVVKVAAANIKDTSNPKPPAPQPAVKPAAGKKPAPKVETTEKPAPKADGEKAVAKAGEGEPELIDGEYLGVNFDKLASFEYEVPEEEYDPDKEPDPDAKTADQIPVEIKGFNKKRVALKGFMLPLKVEDGLITELLIMRDQSMCCYGTVPKINEWVSVRMTGKGVKPIMDQAVTVYGRLKVGEIRENGYLVGIYEMDGEKMIGPLEF